MSDAAPPIAPRDAAPSGTGPERGSRPARWLDRLSVLLLIAATAVVIAAATPEILRGAGFAPVVIDEPRTAPAIATVAPRRATLRFDDAPPAADDDDASRLAELERLFPDGLRRAPRGGQPRDTPSPATTQRVGRALSALTLRERSDAASAVTGRVPPGVRLMVVRETGEWVMVVWQSPDGVLVGWTQRSAIGAP